MDITYRFTQTVEFSANGKTYLEGTEDTLSDWAMSDVAAALGTGLIEVVETEKKGAKAQQKEVKENG